MLQLNNFYIHALSFTSIRFSSHSTAKRLLKNYKFPEILPKDCEEQYIRGWGPGGSCVNSSSNAVLLKHKPTGCFVKVDLNLVFKRVPVLTNLGVSDSKDL